MGHAHHIEVCCPTPDSRTVVDLDNDHIAPEDQVYPSNYEIEEEAGSTVHVLADDELSPPCRERVFGSGIATVGEGSNRRWVTET